MIKELRAWRALPKGTRYDVATHAARDETLPDPAVAAIALARAQVRRRLWTLTGPCASLVAFVALLLTEPAADHGRDIWSLAGFAVFAGIAVAGITTATAQNLVAVEAAAVRTAARADGGAGPMPVETGRVVLRRHGADQGPVHAALASITATGTTAYRVAFTVSILLMQMPVLLHFRGTRWFVGWIVYAVFLVVLVTITVVRAVDGRRAPLLVLSPDGVQVPQFELQAPWSAFGRADVDATGYALQLRLYLRSAEEFKTFSTLPAARRRAAYRQIAGAGGAIAIPMASFADAPADVLRWCWTYRAPVPTA